MPHALVEQYVAERDQLLNTINVLKNASLDRKGDPNTDELELTEKSYSRIDNEQLLSDCLEASGFERHAAALLPLKTSWGLA